MKKLGLDEISTSRMSKPRGNKLRSYEAFFRVAKELSHDICVNSNNEIVDGYCSYLIAKKYNYDGYRIHVMKSDTPVKVVRCRYYRIKDKDVKLGEKEYSFVYALKSSVCPGDIVKVKQNDTYSSLVVTAIECFEPCDTQNITGRIAKTTPYMLVKNTLDERVMVTWKTNRYI